MAILFLFSFAWANTYADYYAVSEDRIENVALKDIKDPDFVNAKQLDERWASIQFRTFTDEKKRRWRLQIIENKQKTGPTWFIPHDDENTAFAAGVYAIKKYGGKLVAIDCKERRTCRRLDPNRNFLKRNRIFNDTILNYFNDPKYPVLTLHNNHHGHQAIGGRGVIYSRVAKPYRGGHASFSAGDPDNMVIFADTKNKKRSKVFADFSDLFDRLKLNYIFEFANPRSRPSGHMSSYVMKNTRLGYFNIEAQFGQLEAQKSYIDRVMLVINDPEGVRINYEKPKKKPAMRKIKPKKKRKRRKKKPRKGNCLDPFGIFCN